MTSYQQKIIVQLVDSFRNLKQDLKIKFQNETNIYFLIEKDSENNLQLFN